MNALPSNDVMSYYNLFLTSMQIEDSKGKSITLYWNDYIFFDEIYTLLQDSGAELNDMVNIPRS